MNYLERNQRILAEARDLLVLEPKGLSIAYMGTGFATAGSFDSQEAGRRVWAGLKFLTGYSDKFDNRYRQHSRRAAEELFLMDLIDRDVPQITAMLPVFHGVVMDGEQRVLAVATEDFSQGGRYEVKDCEEIPIELDNFFKNNYPRFDVWMSHFIRTHIAFRAGGSIRLVDFDHVVFIESADNYRIRELEAGLERYAIQVDRDIVQELLD